MRRYCAYQERCHQEVRRKLCALGLYGDNLEEVVADLVSEGYLNEERFARAFARGKFRIKHWGRRRIVRELKKRSISEYCIHKGLEEIEEEDYLNTLARLLEKRPSSWHGLSGFELRKKRYELALRRGFEPQLIQTILDEASD